MFVNDRVIFLHLQKTGGTYVTEVLKKLWGGVEQDKHGRLEADPAGRLVVGAVRDPYDWYVSLWAYGCARKGVLHWHLTAPNHWLILSLGKQSLLHPGNAAMNLRKALFARGKDAREWARLYGSHEDPGLFREWLRRIASEPGKRLLTEQYPVLPLSRAVGFYTYRFLHLYTDPAAWDREARRLTSMAEVEAFYRRHRIVDRFLRTERLDADLARLILDLVPEAEVSELPRGGPRVNESRRNAARLYYDAETRGIVEREDAMIFEEFDYPRLQEA